MKNALFTNSSLIEVPTIKYSMIEGTSTGYVRIIQFTPETAKRLQDALDSFEKSNYNILKYLNASTIAFSFSFFDIALLKISALERENPANVVATCNICS